MNKARRRTGKRHQQHHALIGYPYQVSIGGSYPDGDVHRPRRPLPRPLPLPAPRPLPPPPPRPPLVEAGVPASSSSSSSSSSSDCSSSALSASDEDSSLTLRALLDVRFVVLPPLPGFLVGLIAGVSFSVSSTVLLRALEFNSAAPRFRFLVSAAGAFGSHCAGLVGACRHGDEGGDEGAVGRERHGFIHRG